MKLLLTFALTFAVMISVFSEINYRAAKQAVARTEMTDSDICSVMGLYGFDMDGNPFAHIGYFEKVKAFFTSNI